MTTTTKLLFEFEQPNKTDRIECIENFESKSVMWADNGNIIYPCKSIYFRATKKEFVFFKNKFGNLIYSCGYCLLPYPRAWLLVSNANLEKVKQILNESPNTIK